MFGGTDEFEEEMKGFRDEENARNVSLALKNPKGLDLKTEKMRRAVQYTSKGGGSIVAVAKRRRHYNSNYHGKRVELEVPIREATDPIPEEIAKRVLESE